MFIELPHEIVELKFSCILRGYWCINQPIDLDKLRGGIRNPFAFFSDTKGIQSVDTDASDVYDPLRTHQYDESTHKGV